MPMEQLSYGKDDVVIALKWKVITIVLLSVASHLVVYNAPLMFDDDKAILTNADVQVSCFAVIKRFLNQLEKK